MPWATVSVSMVLCLVLCTTGYGVKGKCSPPDCSKEPRVNRSCSDPCEKYTCVNSKLNTEKCLGAGDPKCSSSFADPNAPFPDCCGIVFCS
uniref:8.9 kDa family member n=1 Tax=Rhipicephalus appendiculatus TaxID=34631 RepID=A0A131YTX6_RHIAP